MFEKEVGSVHKAEDSWGGEGRCLLLFTLEEMFLKPKVISSQAGCNWALQLPNCIWSHSAPLAAEAAGWGAAAPLRCEGIRASSALRLCQRLHPKCLSRWEILDQPPYWKLQDEVGWVSVVLLIFWPGTECWGWARELQTQLLLLTQWLLCRCFSSHRSVDKRSSLLARGPS